MKQPDPRRPIEFRADGPFAIVRHPIYLGWVLMVFATPTMTTSRMLFAVISTLYLIAAIPFLTMAKNAGSSVSGHRLPAREVETAAGK